MSLDGQLKNAVLEELKWEPSVSEAHIGVTAKDGVISLSGYVDTYPEKAAAERAVGRVKGVKAVAEELKIKLNLDFKRTDEEICAAAIDRLGWNVSVPKDAIKVKVQDGWVTLTGELAWNFQKNAVHDEIRWLSGVVGVSNLITIAPRVNTRDVSDSISHALHRSWYFDPQTVFVTAKAGAIKLTGTVHTWQERNVAAMTAWSAPGATQVENDITVVS